MEDIEATRSLLGQYAAASDAASIDVMVPLFTEDAQMITPLGSFSNAEGVEKFFTEAWSSDSSKKKHFVTNIIPTWRGAGVVDAEAYFLYVARAVGSSIIGWGRYIVTTRVEAGRARFSGFELKMQMVTEVDKGWPLKDRSGGNAASQ